MFKNVKRGWYRVVNPAKVIPPVDKHMNSFRLNEGSIELEYKSSLELIAIRYADFNKHIIRYAIEPFAIKYIKPTDGKYHRYYIDLVLEFASGDKFLVEVKSSGETKPPRKPKKKTEKALINYQKALQTYYVNKAKWEAAEEFAKNNGFRFIILTEEQLK